jgi:hypothetical protein
MSHYRIYTHMYYDEDTDSYRLNLWTYGEGNVQSMAITASLSEQDLTELERQITRARGQKAVHLEDPIHAA